MPEAPFTAEVKLAGNRNWKPLFVYKADSKSKQPHAYGGAEGFVKFAFTGKVDVRITMPHNVQKVVIRPSLRNAIPTEVNDKVITFKMDRPRYLALEINQLPESAGKIPRYMLYLLADEPEINPPGPEDKNVKCLTAGKHTVEDFDPGSKSIIYLAEGVHTIEKGITPLHSGKTLYISDGAILRSKIIGDDVTDAKLLGRGIIDGSTTPRVPGDWRSEGEQGFIFLRRGERIIIDGPVIYNCPYWNIVPFGTKDLTIRNHKAVTWIVNNDGVQPRSCTDLLVEHCFFKCDDDCIAIKTRRAAAMESRRLTFRDLVLWNDYNGNPMEIGHTSQADLLEDVVFKDIEVIYGDGPDHHTINMRIIDHSTVRNVRYENIYVEGTKVKDIGLRVTRSRYTTDEERGQIRDVVIRNYYSDEGPQGGSITGFDTEHTVENVSIENFVIFAGNPEKRKVIESLDQLNLTIKHAGNIKLTRVLPATQNEHFHY